MPTHRVYTTLICSFLLIGAANLKANDAEWPRWSAPEEAGFRTEALAELERHWNALGDARDSSLFVVYKGKVLASLGSETYPYWCHSMRKSFLSALYGIHVEQGNLDLDATLAELGIDDYTPLTAVEKQARVVHLLKARSGIYLEAACEAPGTDEARPPRGSHPPDTFWFYNNWDFNALGTIFREQAGRDIFDEFDQIFARPLGMQDFEAGRCIYSYEPVSMHPCYTFRMSTRDRARFGQLFLQNGRWGDRQIVSRDWLEESTRAYSATPAPGLGYSYMWWAWGAEAFEFFLDDTRLHRLSGFSANGYGGQMIMVLPDADMVVVFSVDVYDGADLDVEETMSTLEKILTSGEITDLAALRAKVKPSTAGPGDRLRLIAKVKNRSGQRSRATTVDFYLSADKHLEGEPRWLGAAKLAAMSTGKRKSARLTTRLPEDLDPGRYYLVAVADGGKANYDLHRQNNLVLGRKRIKVSD